MYSKHLKEYIIEPTLHYIELYSPSAVNLLLGTAMQESCCGEYLHQIGGPALGIYQIEPNTHKDILNNFLSYRHVLLDKVLKLRIPNFTNDQNLIGNLYYSTAIARFIYYRIPERLPKEDDIEGLARYWKKYYNTEYGKGYVSDFIESYRGFLNEVH